MVIGDMQQQYANNVEKSKRARILSNNMQTMMRKVIQQFASEKKHSGQSGSDPGMQICKTDAEEVLLSK